jgi:integrase
MLTTTNGEKAIAGVARKTLNLLHEKAEKILDVRMKRFSLHDLRRTVRTHLSRLGVSEVVAELVLGHALKGLQARYNVYGFAQEKRDALENWAQELTAPEKT